MSLKLALLATALVTVVVARMGVAQPLKLSEPVEEAASGLILGAAAAPSDCPGAAKLDDGGFESGWGFVVTPSANKLATGSYVQKYFVGGGKKKIVGVCVCWRRTGTDDTLDFDLVAWNRDFWMPFTPLFGKAPKLRASKVPKTPKWYRFDLSKKPILIDQVYAYIGPQWKIKQDQKFFVCSDSNGPNVAEIFGGWVNRNEDWPPSDVQFQPADAHALGIRVFLKAVP